MSVTIVQQRLVGRGTGAGARRWIYAGEDPAWPIVQAPPGIVSLERVSIADALAESAERLRRPYLDWIGELGVLNDSFEWWSSPLAAKNAFTYLFQRLCLLDAVPKLLEDGMLVVCSTAALAGELGRAADRRGLAVDAQPSEGAGRSHAWNAAYGPYLMARAVTRRRAAPRPVAQEGHTLLATWIDDRSFAPDGSYRDPHFGPLADLLRERGETVGMMGRVLLGAPFAQTARRLRASAAPVFLTDALLGPADRRDSWRRAQAFDPEIPPDATVAGVPSASLAREFVDQQRANHADAITYEAIARGMAATGIRPKRIVVPWEGYAWETALLSAVREYLPATTVVAYDNLNFSRFALSMYPGRSELGVRPLPDRVVTNGETFARVLEREGFPAERIRIGCALRHAELLERPPADVTVEKRYVLAAGSIDPSQTIEMVVAAHAAFGDELLVKLHPAANPERVRRAVPPSVRFADEPIPDLLTAARALVYTYSVVPYEALLAGVPPIFFRSEVLLDLDQLDPTPDVRWVAGSVEELRDATQACEAAGTEPAWIARARAVVARALAAPDDRAAEPFLGG